MEPQRLCGNDLDPLGRRDVIGHVTIGSADPKYPTRVKPEVDQMTGGGDMAF